MTTLIWILIAIAVFVVIVGVALRATRERRLDQRRAKAQELRREAEARSVRADEREALAREQAEIASTERAEAEKVGARANVLDPDTDDE